MIFLRRSYRIYIGSAGILSLVTCFRMYVVAIFFVTEMIVVVAGKKNTIKSVVTALSNVDRYKQIRSFSHFVTYRLSKRWYSLLAVVLTE